MPKEIKFVPDAFYDLGDIPELTGMSHGTVERARLDGELPASKKGHRWFTTGVAIIAWLTPKAVTNEAQ